MTAECQRLIISVLAKVAEGRLAMDVAEAMAQVADQAGPEGLERVRACLEILAGQREPDYPHDDQEATRLFFPGLRAQPWYEPEEFAWASSVESASSQIGAELEAVRKEQVRFSPYEDPYTKELGWSGWETLSLYRNGIPNKETRARCPATARALDQTPHGLREAMFAILRPGSHITPHTGGVNLILTCHLALVVPPGCGIRVGDETREWQEGKCLIFDDSFMHEAWNNGTETRAVLLWDIWHPDLTVQEIKALTYLFPRFRDYLLGT
jgi:aspartyl/asparaginyl beta-hydroxylase (cupin superfamily)